MKAAIEVSNRKEAELISTALEDPTAKALIVTMGALDALPSLKAKLRVLAFVRDKLEETNGELP